MKMKVIFLLFWFNNLISIISSVNDLDSAKNQFEESINELKNFDINSLSQNINGNGRIPYKCSPNQLLGHFYDLIVPEDYEEGEQMDMYLGVNHINETIEKLNRFERFSTKLGKRIKPIIKRLSSRLFESMLLVHLSDNCRNSLVRTGISLYNMESWALNFLDALPFFETGSVEVNGFPTGGYDECLMIKSQAFDGMPSIRGQYCSMGLPQIMPSKQEYEKNEMNESFVDLINFKIEETQKKHNSVKSMPQRIKNFYLTTTFVTEVFVTNDYSKTFDTKLPIGICLPTTCTAQEVEYALNKVFYPIIRFPIAINPDCDYEDKPVKLNSYAWTTILIFSSLLVLSLLSTAYELKRKLLPKKSKQISIREEIMNSFSMISNFKNIFFSERRNERFAVLDGIRTILSFWVLLCHEHLLSLLPFNSKRIEASTGWGLIMSKNYSLMKNLNIIDTFFFIGGMMTCYVMLSKLQKSKGEFNYLSYVLYRYLRIIPATLGAILLIFIYPLFGSGPFWTQTTNMLYIPCRDNWLSSVLMTSNFDISFPEKYICNTGNWYISSDFQLHVIAPLIFLVLYYYPIYGVIWNLSALCIGIFICVAPKIIWDIPHFFEYPRVDSIWTVGNLFIIYYWRPDPHLVSYVFGILCGYFIREKPNLYFGGRAGESLLWLICSSLTFGTIYWINNMFDPYYDLTTTELLCFVAFSKFLYLCGWFWLFYACATGRAGFVNRFLSWNGFKSTSNLSFEVCILHSMVILYRVGTSRDAYFYSPFFVWGITFFDYLVTFIISVVFYLLVSGPFANLVNIYIKSKIN